MTQAERLLVQIKASAELALAALADEHEGDVRRYTGFLQCDAQRLSAIVEDW